MLSLKVDHMRTLRFNSQSRSTPKIRLKKKQQNLQSLINSDLCSPVRHFKQLALEKFKEVDIHFK